MIKREREADEDDGVVVMKDVKSPAPASVEAANAGDQRSTTEALASAVAQVVSGRTACIPAQFVQPPRDAPVDVTAIQYGILSQEDIHRLSVLPCRRVIGQVKEFGINDGRLGVSDRGAICSTCKQRSVDCVGHAGHIDLEAPVFHLGFFTAVLRICRTICKCCSHVLLTPEEMAFHTRRLQSSSMEPQQRVALVKQIQEDAYKTRICLHCGGVNGVVRRVRPLRIVHERYRVELRRGEETDDDPVATLHDEMRLASQHNKDVLYNLDHIHDFLDPARVRQLLLAIPREQMVLLGLSAGTRPVDMLITSLLVPPVCARPRGMSTNNQVREDDLSTQYNDILISSDALKEGSNDVGKYVDNWETLQTRAARLLDAALPGFPAHLRVPETKSFAQRMKGKHGRFRGNLSGKRVDFSGRSVISPDPNLDIDELAVPLHVARVLTYPQRVFAHNFAFMQRLVRNGPNIHPGAITVYLAKESSRKSLHNARDREALATRLAIGDVVERHIINGDMVLFNRQPSLHRISMMAHRARVLPFRTFRFNECCCSPYNADFDGDEMNIHVVQTEEARAEAKELMLTANNIVTAKNGEPIIACTQDFLTAAYLITAREVFIDRSQFTQMVSHWLGATTQYQLPIPAILKPRELWTGKQVFEVILRPSQGADTLLSLEAKAKFYSGKEKHRDSAEGFVSFLDSIFLSGRLDKKLLGGGSKDSFFARLYALSGGLYTAKCMSRIAQFTSRYLQNYGFSFGLGDVAPTPSLNEKKTTVLAASLARCDALIQEASTGRLAPIPGLTIKQSLEAKLNAELSKVRDECGSAAVDALDPVTNAPLIMVNSGSKGSALNTAQMMACVGQQTVSGKRIVNAFQDRSLPHFPRLAEDPGARGFVASSFFSGLSPTEFFFHTMAGREGLVDTAVKTAETGYIYRRLSKAMENLSVQYDSTVRHANGSIVQLRYGEDGMDPWLMEGAAGTPLNLDQEWLASRASYARQLQRRMALRAAVRDGHTGRKSEASGQLAVSEEDSALRCAAEALVPDQEFIQTHITSLIPGDVVAFAAGCLSESSHILRECEAREARERTESEAIHRWLQLRTTAAAARRGNAEVAKPTHSALEPQKPSTPTSMTTAARISAAALPVQVLRRLGAASSTRFRADVKAFFTAKAKEQERLRALLELPVAGATSAASTTATSSSRKRRAASPTPRPKRTATGAADGSGEVPMPYGEALQTELLPLTEGMLTHFLEACARKYVRKACEPGTPCGAIAAQSVGEPSTQMTLRTFHFAGVASMSITQGVPRLVEVINANKNIATPVIVAPIVLNSDGHSAALPSSGAAAETAQRLYRTCRTVKGLVERVLLKEVTLDMVEVVSRHHYFIQIHLNMPLIRSLLLPIDAVMVRQRILLAATKPMSALRHIREDCVEVRSQDSIAVYPYVMDPDKIHFNIQQLLALLPEVVVGGIAGINRVMVGKGGAELIAEGAEMRAVMTLPHVDGTRTTCNHVAVVERTLGIEAARQVIVNEICGIMNAYSLSIDIRHIYLLADVMTSRGAVLGITRYGIQKMNNNVLTMASFERTTEHLYNAAIMQRTDTNLSVSESIIIGKPVPLGTSAFSLLLGKGTGAPQQQMTGTLRDTKREKGLTATVLQRFGATGVLRGAMQPVRTHRRTPLAASGVFRLDLFE